MSDDREPFENAPDVLRRHKPAPVPHPRGSMRSLARAAERRSTRW